MHYEQSCDWVGDCEHGSFLCFYERGWVRQDLGRAAAGQGDLLPVAVDVCWPQCGLNLHGFIQSSDRSGCAAWKFGDSCHRSRGRWCARLAGRKDGVFLPAPTRRRVLFLCVEWCDHASTSGGRNVDSTVGSCAQLASLGHEWRRAEPRSSRLECMGLQDPHAGVATAF